MENFKNQSKKNNIITILALSTILSLAGNAFLINQVSSSKNSTSTQKSTEISSIPKNDVCENFKNSLVAVKINTGDDDRSALMAAFQKYVLITKMEKSITGNEECDQAIKEKNEFGELKLIDGMSTKNNISSYLDSLVIRGGMDNTSVYQISKKVDLILESVNAKKVLFDQLTGKKINNFLPRQEK